MDSLLHSPYLMTADTLDTTQLSRAMMFIVSL